MSPHRESGTDEGATRGAWSRPWPWIVVLVLLRAWLALCCADVYFYGEELAKGTCAKVILERPPIPYWKAVYGYHEGGGFVVAHLKALGFALLGESLLVHKLVGLLTASLVLSAGWMLARQAFGARAAAIFAFLYALAPAAFVQFSLLTIGTHFEALFFAAHVLRLSLKIVDDGGGAREDWLWLGLATGFGTYFSLQTLPVALCACVVLLVGLRRKFLSRGLAFGAAAFAVGAAPLVSMALLAGELVWKVRGATYGKAADAGPVGALLDLFGPLSVADHSIALDVLLFAAQAALALACLALWRGRRLAVLALLGYVALYLALYATSGLAVGMGGLTFLWIRICAPWFATTILAAAAIDALWNRRRAVAFAVLASYGAAGLQDLARLTATGSPATLVENAKVLATTRGVDYPQYFELFLPHFDVDKASKARIAMHLDDPTPELPAATAQVLWGKAELPTPVLLDEVRAAFGPLRWRAAVLGLGRALHPGEDYDLPHAFSAISVAPVDVQPLLAEAIGRSGIGPRFRVDRLQELVDAPGVPEQWREAWWRGCGWRVRMTFRLVPTRGRAWIAGQPEPMRSALLAGFERCDADLRLP